jgi:hypothetical protein
VSAFVVVLVLGIAMAVKYNHDERIWKQVQLGLLHYRIEKLKKPTGNAIIDGINKDHIEELQKLYML